MSSCPHLSDALGNLQTVVDKVSEIVEKYPDCEYIACTGVSGLLVAAPVAYKTGKKLYIVRKVDDLHTHSIHNIEYVGVLFKKKVIIIDDLISSGDTIRRLYRMIKHNYGIPEIAILYYETGTPYEYNISESEKINIVQIDESIN